MAATSDSKFLHSIQNEMRKPQGSGQATSIPPTGSPAPTTNAKALRATHRKKYDQRKGTKTPYVGGGAVEGHVSETPLSKLNPISYDQLRVNIRATGSFLMLRVLEKALLLAGADCPLTPLTVPVEDQVGNVVPFVVHNFVSLKICPDPERVLAVGTVFLLKEPWLKPTSRGGCRLQCDSPSDVVVVGRDHPFYEIEKVAKIDWEQQVDDERNLASFNGITAGEWREMGNELFKRKEYQEAREAYGVALMMAEKEELGAGGLSEMRIVLHLNLAAVYLTLEYFEKTIQHCNIVLNNSPENPKALFRAGRAHYELRQFQSAHDLFARLLHVQPVDLRNSLELAKCKCRLEEAQNGVDIYKLHLATKRNPRTCLDIADYHGPLTVAAVPGKFRGVLATQDIQPGTLLLVSKAVHASFWPTNMPPICRESSINDPGCDGELVSGVLQGVLKNPNTVGKAVYDLTSNSHPMDSSKRYCDKATKDEPISHAKRIGKIVAVNAFRLTGGKWGRVIGAGLFPAASYFNHSCVANAVVAVFNDVLVVHAVKLIPKDTEITIPYHDIANTTFSQRQLLCTQRGFTCHCQLCLLEQADPPHLRIEQERLVDQWQLLMTECRPGRTTTEHVKKRHRQLVKQIRATYGSRTKWQLALFQPSLAQAQIDFDSNRCPKRFLANLTAAYACVGIKLEKVMAAAGKGCLEVFDREAVVNVDFSVLARCLVRNEVYFDTVQAARRVLSGLEAMMRVMNGSNRAMVKEKFD